MPPSVHILHVGRACRHEDVRVFNKRSAPKHFARKAVGRGPDNDDARVAKIFSRLGHLWPEVFCDTVVLVGTRHGPMAVYLSDRRGDLHSPEALLRFLARELHEGFWHDNLGAKVVADACLIEWFRTYGAQ